MSAALEEITERALSLSRQERLALANRLLSDDHDGDVSEVETAWEIVDSIRKAWEGKPLSNREFYAAGTWGPVAADDLLAQCGHAWREPQVIK